MDPGFPTQRAVNPALLFVRKLRNYKKQTLCNEKVPKPVEAHSHRAKAKNFYDVCRFFLLFFELFSLSLPIDVNRPLQFQFTSNYTIGLAVPVRYFSLIVSITILVFQFFLMVPKKICRLAFFFCSSGN